MRQEIYPILSRIRDITKDIKGEKAKVYVRKYGEEQLKKIR